MTNYVAGFALDYAGTHVLLVRKNTPEWQRGLLNGIGGKVEPEEGTYNAMVREWQEETGTYIGPADWRLLVTLHSGEHTIDFFTTRQSIRYLETLHTHTNDVDEDLELWNVLDLAARGDKIPNLAWLVPLAAYGHDLYAPLLAIEEGK